MKRYLLFSIIFLFLFSAQAHAAVLYLLPEKQQFNIGEEFSVDVKVNTEETSINATQATIHFPTDVLELVEEDRAGSTFRFWVEEPTISNEDGTLKFIGGAAKGVSGEALQIVKMRFKTRGSGTAELTVSDAVVTASDGKGTNVLSTIEGTSIAVGTAVVTPKAPEPPPSSAPAAPEIPKVVEKPKAVVREALKATNLPVAPEIRVPLYPDETQWYGHLGEVVVFWELPDDVVQVSTRLSKSKDKKTGEKDDELFTGKSLGIIEEEGIWYVRVQFRNNIGWGELAYYTISVDTSSPLPFEIEIDSEVSDNPAPTIQFETQDSLSGISHAHIFVDGKGPIVATSTGSFTLPPQPPGNHVLTVKVFDKASNSVEDDLEFEILPLPTPVIDFVTRSVAQEEFVFASGTSIPNGFVDVQIFNEAGNEAFRSFTTSGAGGKWEIIIEEPLARGQYTLQATARDDRGAVSFQTDPVSFKIKAKTIISIGGMDLGWFELVLILMLLVVSGLSIGAWYYVTLKHKREAYGVIVGRDVEKLNAMLLENLNDVDSLLSGEISQHTVTELKGHNQKMKDTIKRMSKYIGKEVEKLR